MIRQFNIREREQQQNINEGVLSFGQVGNIRRIRVGNDGQVPVQIGGDQRDFTSFIQNGQVDNMNDLRLGMVRIMNFQQQFADQFNNQIQQRLVQFSGRFQQLQEQLGGQRRKLDMEGVNGGFEISQRDFDQINRSIFIFCLSVAANDQVEQLQQGAIFVQNVVKTYEQSFMNQLMQNVGIINGIQDVQILQQYEAYIQKNPGQINMTPAQIQLMSNKIRWVRQYIGHMQQRLNLEVNGRIFGLQRIKSRVIMGFIFQFGELNAQVDWGDDIQIQEWSKQYCSITVTMRLFFVLKCFISMLYTHNQGNLSVRYLLEYFYGSNSPQTQIRLQNGQIIQQNQFNQDQLSLFQTFGFLQNYIEYQRDLQQNVMFRVIGGEVVGINQGQGQRAALMFETNFLTFRQAMVVQQNQIQLGQNQDLVRDFIGEDNFQRILYQILKSVNWDDNDNALDMIQIHLLYRVWDNQMVRLENLIRFYGIVEERWLGKSQNVDDFRSLIVFVDAQNNEQQDAINICIQELRLQFNNQHQQLQQNQDPAQNNHESDQFLQNFNFLNGVIDGHLEVCTLTRFPHNMNNLGQSIRLQRRREIQEYFDGEFNQWNDGYTQIFFWDGKYKLKQLYSVEYKQFLDKYDDYTNCMKSFVDYLNTFLRIKLDLFKVSILGFVEIIRVLKENDCGYYIMVDEPQLYEQKMQENKRNVFIAIVFQHIFEFGDAVKMWEFIERLKANKRQKLRQKIQDIIDKNETIENYQQRIMLEQKNLNVGKQLKLGNTKKEEMHILFDLETTTSNNQALEVLIICFCYFFKGIQKYYVIVDQNMQSNEFTVIYSTTPLKTFVEIIWKFCYENDSNLYIGGWNAHKFDNLILLKEILKSDKQVSINLKGNLQNIKFLQINENIFLIDYMRNTAGQMSLDKFAQSFSKIQKMKNDRIGELFKILTSVDKWVKLSNYDKMLMIQYCFYDVQSMVDGVLNFNNEIYDICENLCEQNDKKFVKCKRDRIFTIKSIPSLAFDIISKVILSNNITTLQKSQQYKDVKKSYTGGMTQVFSLNQYDRIKYEIQYIDVNSLYPFIMSQREFTHSLSDNLENFDNKIWDQNLYIVHEFKLTDKFVYGYIPVKSKDQTITYPKYWKGVGDYLVIWGFTLNSILKIDKECQFDISSYYRGLRIKKQQEQTKLFEKIEQLYNLRLKSKQEGNEQKAQILKLIMNSSYGQMGMTDFEQQIYIKIGFYDELVQTRQIGQYIENYLKLNRINIDEVNIERIERIDTIGIVKIQLKYNEKHQIPHSKKSCLVHIASQITNLARDYLLQNMYYLFDRQYQCVYCDTDSMVLVKLKDEKKIDYVFGQLLDDNKLGFFKKEVENIKSFQAFLPKVYKLEFEKNEVIMNFQKCKGISFKNMTLEQIDKMYSELDQQTKNYLNNNNVEKVVVENQTIFYRKNLDIVIQQIQKSLDIKHWKRFNKNGKSSFSEDFELQYNQLLI